MFGRAVIGDVHLRVFADHLRQGLFKSGSKGIGSIVEELLLAVLHRAQTLVVFAAHPL